MVPGWLEAMAFKMNAVYYPPYGWKAQGARRALLVVRVLCVPGLVAVAVATEVGDLGPTTASVARDR